MSLVVFGAVLLAAFLHAAWNAAVRSGADKTTAMAAVVLGQGALGGVLLPFLPLPSQESWPWILSGVVLHLGYQLFLVAAYRTGELSEVYPLARGAAPLLVAGASVTVLGTTLSGLEWAGIILISLGVASVVLVRASGRLSAPSRSTVMALVASVFIAAYSLNDGLGARLSNAPVAFFGWLTLLNAVAFFAILPFWRPLTFRAIPRCLPTITLGGGASFTAYALVVWAFTEAPIALVTALRETSILFALAIGIGLMGERLDLRRVASAFLTLSGAVLLRLGRSS
ncbi:MAG: DMT family transporter [Pseudomonadota bacterium]